MTTKGRRAGNMVSKENYTGKKVSLTENKKCNNKNNDYLYSMSLAPTPEQSTHWFQMLPAAFFTAVIIAITRMHSYERPMEQFFWSNNNNQLTDFFSYFKMVAILICAILALVLILYRVFTQSFYIKRNFAYFPMIAYSIFVLLSYILSDYKIFSLYGWNDRFEGTLTLLSYMVMLFFIINSVNTERNVKFIIYPLALTSGLLGLLGLTQALDHDFFRTTIGKKLITPSWFWDQIDNLNFTFQNKEIYQTVYNINYVAFYLNLLIPIFAMLFIKSILKGKDEALWKKITWGAIFALLLFNLIGAASTGGLMGMAIAVLIGIIVLNKKIIEWKKPVLILLVVTCLLTIISYERLLPELKGAISLVVGSQSEKEVSTAPPAISEGESIRHKVDYIETTGQAIIMSLDGNEVSFITYPNDPTLIKIKDAEGASLSIVKTDVAAVYKIDDKRFKTIKVSTAQDESSKYYLVINTDGIEWPFLISEAGTKYYTGVGSLIDLKKIPSFGWENNQEFGSGRGYIWSRTIPMIKDTLILGHGADTYCIYFPQDDFVGKYNSGTFSNNINIIVDKPHNLYLGTIVGTGCISVLALLALWGIYIAQSFSIYRHESYESFTSFAGAGIFIGICGFLTAGFVNDSSVSVMPMFYGLLGTGISINSMLKKSN